MVDPIVNAGVERGAVSAINDEDEPETTSHLVPLKEQLDAISRVKCI